MADAVSSHARISTREWRAFTNTMDSGARSVELFHLGLPLSCQIARDSVVVLWSLSLRPRLCDCVVSDDSILSYRVIGRKRVGFARNARGTSRAPTAIAG